MRHQKSAVPSADVEDAITSQRNLTAAEARVVEARATYAKSLIRYEVATGTLLARNNIALTDAIEGGVRNGPDVFWHT